MQFNNNVIVLKGSDEPPFDLVLTSAELLFIVGAGTSAISPVGGVSSIISLPLGNEPGLRFPGLLIAVLSGSLALIGPGGYSLDAARVNHCLFSPPLSELAGTRLKRIFQCGS
jgi:hypothetical protein